MELKLSNTHRYMSTQLTIKPNVFTVFCNSLSHSALSMTLTINWLALFTLLLFSKEQLASTNLMLMPHEDFRAANLMMEVAKIFCRAQVKVLYVYFENKQMHDRSGELLRQVTKCDISYISLRNQFQPLDAIKDDGILMYMVMIISDISEPLKLSLINKKSAAKHLSHVILLVRDARLLSLAWMRASFRQFWSIWLLNIVIIFWRNDRLHAYRYNPFTNDFLIRMPLERGKLPTLKQLFPNNIPNMQRKPLRMCLYMDDVRAFQGSTGEILGIDGLLARYIAQGLNATQVITRPMSYTMPNQSHDICSTEIINEFDDIAMNIRFLARNVFKRSVESTITHNRDDLCVIVPKAKAELLFWNIFRSFRSWVWTSLLISMFLSIAFCCVISGHQPTLSAIFALYSSVMSQPLVNIPRNYPLRMFIIFWLYFVMLISTAFKGNLTCMLVYRKSLPDINNFNMLANSQYQILVRSRHSKHIENFLSYRHEQEAKIKQLMVEVPDLELLDHFNENDLSYAYLEKYHIASFQVNARRHMRVGRPLFHLMRTCLVPFHAVYTVPYGSPYLGFFNWLIRNAHEFGFERYWDHIMNAAFIKSGTKIHKRRRHNNSDDPVVLRLEHFHAVFLLWAIGIVLALLVFLWELLVQNWAITKRKR